MKIVNHKNCFLEFSKVNIGQIFKFEDHHYIKTDYSGLRSSFCFETNKSVDFSCNEKIQEVYPNAELHLNP